MKVFISAAEASSDLQGSLIVKGLQAANNEAIQFFGIGGPALEKTGMEIIVPSRELLAMGFSEILVRLPAIVRAFFQSLRAVDEKRPDLAIFIDYPDFNMRLAKKFWERGIPCVYFIPPKVWVWRTGRVKALKKYFRKLFCVFPFEETFYQNHSVESLYVKNPLLDILPLEKTREEAREELGIAPHKTVVALLPGTRPAEIRLLLERMLQTAQVLTVLLGNEEVEFLLPIHEVVDDVIGESNIFETVTRNYKKIAPRIRVLRGQSHLAMRAADVGLIKSGTSTLEAALLNCPHLIVYDASWISRLLFRWVVRYRRAVGLSNLVFDFNGTPPFVFRELLGDDFTPRNAARELYELLKSEKRQNEIQRALTLVQEEMTPKNVVSGFETLLEIAKAPAELPQKKINIVFSCLWSFINFGARKLSRLGLLRSRRLPSLVVSVGNLQAGGAGKTPLVIEAAREATRRGLKTCVLLRGYQSSWEKTGGVLEPKNLHNPEEIYYEPSKDAGDEALLIHEAVPDAWVGVGARRIQSFERIMKKLGQAPDVVILDDGYQHWSLHKDINILALTDLKPGQAVFRDFLSQAKYSDLIFWTKGETVPLIGPYAPQVSIQPDLEFAIPPKTKKLWLICGIAHPHFLRTMLKKEGFEIERETLLRDHEKIDLEFLSLACETAMSEGLQILITKKDKVKIRDLDDSLKAQIAVVDLKFLFPKEFSGWDQIYSQKSL